jgi:hypothetical protein
MVLQPAVMRGRTLNNLKNIEFCCYFIVFWLTLFTIGTVCGVYLNNDLLLLGVGLACIISGKEERI